MIEQALAVASDNAETARKALEQRDALLKRIEFSELELEYSAKLVFQAKQLLEEVLTVREMGPDGPIKNKIRAFLKSITRE